ncbi:MAG: DsbA family protein [Bacteroidia bacterium]|nr:DsbA family protein [Bacteroidia bacterium]
MQQYDKPLILYVYDALCGWCYGFSPVIKKAAEVFENDFYFVTVSGGMITGDRIGPISQMAGYIKKAYKGVEEKTGITFGEGYLKLLDEGTYLNNSIKPAIAMSVFKSFFPLRSIEFAHDLQAAHLYNGKDLNGRDVYFELIEKYGIDKEEFLARLNSEKFQQQTFQEFDEVKRLGITGFPTVLVQINDEIFTVSNGFINYEELAKRLIVIQDNIKNPQ